MAGDTWIETTSKCTNIIKISCRYYQPSQIYLRNQERQKKIRDMQDMARQTNSEF